MSFKNIRYLGIIVIGGLLLAGCGTKNEEIFFETDENDTFFESVDEQANENIEISEEFEVSQEFDISYKTFEPDGMGVASFKAKSVNQVDMAGEVEATEGMKLVLVEIAVKGDADNQGKPSTFNQIGDHPSPQFVLIDKNNDVSYVEQTYYSDAYTQDKDLFELSKITMDHEQWVNTAIVFEIESDKETDLAFRFTNEGGETEFYDIIQDE